MPNRIWTVATASLASALQRLQREASGPCTDQVKGKQEANLRKAAIRTIAPAALATALLALASGWDAAQSKSNVDPCTQRFTACLKRCDQRYGGGSDYFKKTGRDGTLSCLDRTCSPQKRNCEAQNPKSPKSSPSPKGEGSPGAKQNDAKPKKGIDGTSSGTWVPKAKQNDAKQKKGIDSTSSTWVRNSQAKGKRVPSVPAGGTWNPSPSSSGKAQNLKSGGRR
ncbi:MAG TPA: hypothetical protein VG758_22805 [Hyphomicrobiaceae bacterium]|jgi:hypothetical protein|nr:hypothetical protein [Hyphomicrobiaceae bacterium]